MKGPTEVSRERQAWAWGPCAQLPGAESSPGATVGWAWEGISGSRANIGQGGEAEGT